MHARCLMPYSPYPCRLPQRCLRQGWNEPRLRSIALFIFWYFRARLFRVFLTLKKRLKEAFLTKSLSFLRSRNNNHKMADFRAKRVPNGTDVCSSPFTCLPICLRPGGRGGRRQIGRQVEDLEAGKFQHSKNKNRKTNKISYLKTK